LSANNGKNIYHLYVDTKLNLPGATAKSFKGLEHIKAKNLCNHLSSPIPVA